MTTKLNTIEVEVGEGIVVSFETLDTDFEKDVSLSAFSFDGVATAIEGVSNSIIKSINKIKPSKAIVEFGVVVTAESGQLTALIVKGAAEANLKITLEWEQENKNHK